MNIRKVAHHIRHTRPKWYNDYHKWKYHVILHWATFVVSSLIIVIGLINVAIQINRTLAVDQVQAATTTLTQDITGGSLTISNNGNQSLSSVSVSTSQQNSTGNLGTITVDDARGSGAGWTATATSTNFYKINSVVLASGSNNTVTLDGTSTYASSSAGTYTITITTGGTNTTALFSVTGPASDNATNQTAGSGVAIGSRGITVTFGAATYQVGDSWTIRVDTINVTNMNITPGSVTTITGSSTNVTPGSFHVFNSPSDSSTLVTASYNYGMGSYSVTPSLQLIVPANSYANTYTATVTETVS